MEEKAAVLSKYGERLFAVALALEDCDLLNLARMIRGISKDLNKLSDELQNNTNNNENSEEKNHE